MKQLRNHDAMSAAGRRRRAAASEAGKNHSSDVEKLALFVSRVAAPGESRPTKRHVPESSPEMFWWDRRVYDSAPIGFVTLDRRARIIALNKKAANLLGLPADWLLHHAFLVFVAKQDVQLLIRFLIKASRETGVNTFEINLVVERRLIPVQLSLTTTNIDGALIYEMAIVDVSQTKRVESWLNKALAHWYSLVQNAPDTIMTLESSGKITFVNADLWGYPPSSLVGSSIFDYVSETERSMLRRCCKRVFREEVRSECEIVRVDGGRQSWFTLSFGPGKVSGPMGLATVFIRDISDQKRSEETLRNSSAQLREFAARLEAVREEERTRVARELHDELGQVLTILKLDLSWVHGKIRSHRELRKKTSAMIDYVDATIERVRQISSELRPSILDDLGLSAAIEWQGAEFQKRTGIRIRVQSDADHVILPKDCQAATFRVVQEALTNVIRHAEARTVQVTLKSVKNELKISVADDGKGMTQERLRDTKSLGIVGMKERIARLGGEFGIFSEPGKGTRLDIIIPAHND